MTVTVAGERIPGFVVQKNRTGDVVFRGHIVVLWSRCGVGVVACHFSTRFSTQVSAPCISKQLTSEYHDLVRPSSRQCWNLLLLVECLRFDNFSGRGERFGVFCIDYRA